MGEGFMPKLTLFHCINAVAEVDDFLADKKGVTRLDSSIYEVKKENLPEETQVVVLKPSR